MTSHTGENIGSAGMDVAIEADWPAARNSPRSYTELRHPARPAEFKDQERTNKFAPISKTGHGLH